MLVLVTLIALLSPGAPRTCDLCVELQ